MLWAKRVTCVAGFVSCLTLVILASGCGGGGMPTGRVSGTITLDGKPLDGATIVFRPSAKGDSTESGKQATGVSNAEGKYSLSTYTLDGNDGAVIGTHKITIVGKEGIPIPGKSQDFKEVVPKKYWSFSTSGMQVEVKSGNNTIDLPLKTGE